MQKDNYPLPRIDEMADALAGSEFFSIFDVDRAFWQVVIAPEDRCKTAFSIDNRLFVFNKMPFGDKNAPGTF